jgi:predicted ester cyclase
MTFLSNTPYNDVCQRLSPGPQSMRGFDGRYSDIVDYIIGITYEIWEEKKVGLIHDYYTEDSVIHTSSGDIVGAETVVNNTAQQLSLFPDRRLFPDDIIWAGNDIDGFYSSHRIRSTAHHRGYSIYGQPTGRKLQYNVIADCAIANNKIYEEWLVRDDLSIIRQMGLDEREFAAKLVAMYPEKYNVASQQYANRSDHLEPPGTRTSGFDPEDFIKQTWHDAWNRRMFDSFLPAYLSTAHCHSAAGRELFGQDDIVQFAMDWLSCFPDGRMSFDHFCAVGGEDNRWRTSLRWTFSGTHNGYGIYGDPGGKPICIMGITHSNIQDGKIIEEWTVFDELTLLCQLVAENS